MSTAPVQSEPLLLDFELPDRTRVIWASDRLRHTWQPRIDAFSSAWVQVERESVAAGHRASALQVAAPEDLPALQAWCEENDLALLVLGTLAASDGYSVTSQAAQPGGPVALRVAVAQGDLVGDWRAAWAEGDDDRIGGLLGFPPCCVEHFGRWWVDQGWRDPTWPAHRDGGDGPLWANILLRWLGVRLVPHLPCSPGCELTARQGFRAAGLMSRLGYGQEARWAREMLEWPVLWSALHGAAEIETPVCRVITATTATAERLEVRRHGTRYPEGAPTGTRFPYQPPAGRKLTESRSYRAANRDPFAWEVNGFGSLTAMRQAHGVVTRALVAGEQALAGGAMVDLGAGNGELLRRLGLASAHRWSLRGVEREPAALQVPADGVALVDGDLFNAEHLDGADLVVLMPGRLLEVGEERAEGLRRRLEGVPVLAYCYGDWTARHGGLEGLLRAAGLPAPQRQVESDPQTEAVLL